jgi:uncharacterized protein YjeT (DUF2065 family)
VIATIIMAVGLAAVLEGLVFALAPSRIEDALRLLAQIPPETRRLIGLGVIAAGVVIAWLGVGLAS